MRKPHIYEGDKGIDFELFYEGGILEYNGTKFTGTLIDDNTEPKSYSEYKNGDLDGDDISYFENGKLAEKNIFKNGEYISGKQWYENGQLRFDSENIGVIFDRDGIKTTKDGKWLYKTGKERLVTEDRIFKLFSSDGHLAISHEPSEVIVNNYPTQKVYYYHKVLIANYINLLEHIYIHPEDNCKFRKQIENLLTSWIIELYRTGNMKEAILIFNNIIKISEEKLKENLDFRIRQLEETYVSNSKIQLKRIENGEFNYDNNTNINHNISKIIFK